MGITGNRAAGLNCLQGAGKAKRKAGFGRGGFIFSLDLAIAALALIMMSFLMLSHLNFEKEQMLQESERIGLERKAIFLIDAMAKNRNEENPLAGSALLDLEKKRVVQNEIDEELFLRAGQLQDETFFVSSISLDFGNAKEKRFFEKESRKCLALDRLVSANGNIARLEAVVCEKENSE